VKSSARTCCRASTLYDIINEKRAVTADVAARLGRAFGNSTLFWLNLQSQYDAWLAERDEAVRLIGRLKHRAA
jgi:addiction module HigA family antidote